MSLVTAEGYTDSFGPVAVANGDFRLYRLYDFPFGCGSGKRAFERLPGRGGRGSRHPGEITTMQLLPPNKILTRISHDEPYLLRLRVDDAAQAGLKAFPAAKAEENSSQHGSTVFCTTAGFVSPGKINQSKSARWMLALIFVSQSSRSKNCRKCLILSGYLSPGKSI